MKLKELNLNSLEEITKLLENKIPSSIRFKLLKNKAKIEDELNTLTQVQVGLINTINKDLEDKININDDGSLKFPNDEIRIKFTMDLSEAKDVEIELPYQINVIDLEEFDYDMESILFMLTITEPTPIKVV
jgi:hypothetical protein